MEIKDQPSEKLKLKGNKLMVVLAFFAIYFIWGSSYLAILFGLEAFPTFLLAGLRFLLAGCLLLLVCYVRGEPTPRRSALLQNSFCGVLMLAIGSGSVIWAEQYVSSGLAAMLVATEPLWFVALDRRSWTFYFSNKVILLALLLGIIGVVVLFLGSQSLSIQEQGSYRLLGIFVILGGSALWVTGALYAKYQLKEGAVWVNSSVQLLAAGGFCLLLSALAGEWTNFDYQSVSLQGWAALGYLAVMGSIVAYTAFLWLLKIRSPAVVGTHTYVNPVVAVFLGWMVAQERVSTIELGSLVVILLGVFLVNLPTYRKKNGK